MTYMLLWGYIGPETMLPLASFIAGLIGALLVGWRYVLATASRIVARILGRPKPSDSLIPLPASETSGEALGPGPAAQAREPSERNAD